MSEAIHKKELGFIPTMKQLFCITDLYGQL